MRALHTSAMYRFVPVSRARPVDARGHSHVVRRPAVGDPGRGPGSVRRPAPGAVRRWRCVSSAKRRVLLQRA